MRQSLHTAYAFSIMGSIIISILGIALAPSMLSWMRTPAEIMADSILYLRIYFLGMIPQMLYNMGTNILRAIGDSKRPLYFLIAASLVNIVLDVVFIAVFGWVSWARAGDGAQSGGQRGADAALHRRLSGDAVAHPRRKSCGCTATFSRPSAPSACPPPPKAPCTTSAICSSRAA